MPSLYLAGPVDAAGADGQTWKTHLLAALKALSKGVKLQWTTYDPAAPWGLLEDYAHEDERCQLIEAVNQKALLSVDGMIAWVPTTKVSVGTPIEIDQFVREWGGDFMLSKDQRDRPLFVFSDAPYSRFVYIRNRVSEEHYFQWPAGMAVADFMHIFASALINYYTPKMLRLSYDKKKAADRSWEVSTEKLKKGDVCVQRYADGGSTYIPCGKGPHAGPCTEPQFGGGEPAFGSDEVEG
jgi:hypothetical protein